jgi:TDG/mug DNA glycosylase family protein
MEYTGGLAIPNLLQADLKILFVGINPGLRSAAEGHHFAGHSSRFWRFLHDSGLTPVKLNAAQDHKLLSLGYGITNIVPRPTAAAAELQPEEFKAGARVLIDLLKTCQPRVAAYLGKEVYRYLNGKTKFEWGRQPVSVTPPVIDFVIPNPSGLNRMPFEDQIRFYRELNQIKES